MASIMEEQIFIGPGLSPFKRIVTALGVVVLTLLVLWIALHQGVSALGSTTLAILFIIGFIIYLRIAAPVPFTITLGPKAVVKRSRNGEIIEVHWQDMTRIKEEFFPRQKSDPGPYGKRISVTMYRKVTTAGQKAKAWAVYRDDVTDFDGLAVALKKAIPPTCTWQSEVVHE
ncbi:MAG: hypothetical protein JO125_06780 [Chloroflexi bacterium]|nr:hypothetical protein [Ktedonobacteraceae bacterium]MBV9020685.1 hypothetical protein [Ktedonobacteraceae bacterium]MBV9707095.1 hypothetical protein [Chloroflexota bacterium]